MAMKHSILVTLIMMITMISMPHCYSDHQNDGVSSTASDLHVPIIARVRVLGGTVRCAIPQTRAARSAPLVANVDAIVLCGDNRVAAAQTLSEPALAFDFVFNITQYTVGDPSELALCKVVVTFPGGDCVADLAPAYAELEKLVAGARTYSVPLYEAGKFRRYNKD